MRIVEDGYLDLAQAICNSKSCDRFRYKDEGYVMVKLPEDSPYRCMAHKNGWIREHRLVMAGVLGRPLLRTEKVHHENGLKWDNRPENLKLCRSNKEHRLIHSLGYECGTCGIMQEVRELRKENELLRRQLYEFRQHIKQESVEKKEIRLLKWQVKQLEENQKVRS